MARLSNQRVCNTVPASSARWEYDDTSSAVQTARPSLIVVSEHEEVVAELSSTDAAQLSFPKEIKMSQRDFKLFLVALESDEEPSDNLKALFQNQPNERYVRTDFEPPFIFNE